MAGNFTSARFLLLFAFSAFFINTFRLLRSRQTFRAREYFFLLSKSLIAWRWEKLSIHCRRPDFSEGLRRHFAVQKEINFCQSGRTFFSGNPLKSRTAAAKKEAKAVEQLMSLDVALGHQIELIKKARNARPSTTHQLWIDRPSNSFTQKYFCRRVSSFTRVEDVNKKKAPKSLLILALIEKGEQTRAAQYVSSWKIHDSES